MDTFCSAVAATGPGIQIVGPWIPETDSREGQAGTWRDPGWQSVEHFSNVILDNTISARVSVHQIDHHIKT